MRRAFLRLLGVAPVAAVVPASAPTTFGVPPGCVQPCESRQYTATAVAILNDARSRYGVGAPYADDVARVMAAAASVSA